MTAHLLQEAETLSEELIRLRRGLHQIPETGLNLPRTAAFVTEELKRLGCAPVRCGESGVTAVIGSAAENAPCILLRGDMDALPIREETGCPYASRTDAMHACGHDMHTAMLLGAAALLKKRERELPGAVKLLFQPGEEILLGAKAMLAAGVLENPNVGAAFALHVSSALPFPRGGIVLPRPGRYTAASDRFGITIRGKGGHGAMPDLAADPLQAACALYQNLQMLITREIAPAEHAVISIGAFHAGADAYNVIPDTASLRGTIRTYNAAVRAYIFRRIPALAALTAEAGRCTAETGLIEGAPSVIIDAALEALLRARLPDIFGSAVCDPADYGQPRFAASEDFAFISERVPGAFCFLTADDPGGVAPYPLHHPRLRLDETVLPRGAALYTAAALIWLENQAGKRP